MKSISTMPVTVIKKGERNYPKQLLDLVDPPEELRVRGQFHPKVCNSSLAVVGSRKVSPYGVKVVETFVPRLTARGATIVSGFMYGVDTLAHRAALRANGRTIAVLGSGLNHVYPSENSTLYTEVIQQGGCIISEYPDDMPPDSWTFPKRNRIVAALCGLGTFVVEAAEMSGTLITAQYTDALNRPLYTVAGSVFSKTAKGSNRLIKDKLAVMITSPEEIVI